MNQEYRILTEKVINDFIDYYCQNPFNFLYEADIQGMLFARLYDAFEEKGIKIPLQKWKDENGKRKYWNEIVGTQQKFINPVKTEYPSSKRFDIAIIDNPSEIKGIKNSWNIPVQIGIELKFCQFDESLIGKLGNRSEKSGTLTYDLNKLYDVKFKKEIASNNFAGLGLMFVQTEKYAFRGKPKDFKKLVLKSLPFLKPVNEIDIVSGINGWVILANEKQEKSIFQYSFQSQ